jgi:hypothetical protein
MVLEGNCLTVVRSNRHDFSVGDDLAPEQGLAPIARRAAKLIVCLVGRLFGRDPFFAADQFKIYHNDIDTTVSHTTHP